MKHEGNAVKPIRFHWSLSAVGDAMRRAQATSTMTGLPSLDAQIEFCRRAEECGVESVLMAIGFTRPDPIALSAALGMRTERMTFMVACRPGLVSPTLFVQQINTLSALTGGRVSVNIVTGHSPKELRYYGDTLSHDERYQRTEEFVAVCRAFWHRDGGVSFRGKFYTIEEGKLNTPFVSSARSAPEIYVGGNSELAARLAVEHADCLWRFPEASSTLRPSVESVVSRGKEVGLLVSIITRATREEALEHARALIERAGEKAREANREWGKRSDSVGFRANLALGESGGSEWLSPCLWTGAIPYLGAPSIALVGSREEVARELVEYGKMGVSQFLFMGWPDLEEMTHFGREVRPIVRELCEPSKRGAARTEAV